MLAPGPLVWVGGGGGRGRGQPLSLFNECVLNWAHSLSSPEYESTFFRVLFDRLAVELRSANWVLWNVPDEFSLYSVVHSCDISCRGCERSSLRPPCLS